MAYAVIDTIDPQLTLTRRPWAFRHIGSCLGLKTKGNRRGLPGIQSLAGSFRTRQQPGCRSGPLLISTACEVLSKRKDLNESTNRALGPPYALPAGPPAHRAPRVAPPAGRAAPRNACRARNRRGKFCVGTAAAAGN